MCIKLVRGSISKNSYRRIWRIVVPYGHAEFRADPFRNEGSTTFFSYFCMAPYGKYIYIKIVGKRRAAESDYNSFTNSLKQAAHSWAGARGIPAVDITL